MNPYRVESVSRASYYDRLQSEGAEYKPEYSTSSRQVYWIGRQNAWLTISLVQGKVIFSYYRGCPCNGG